MIILFYSRNLYGEYFEKLAEIVELFKKAQSVHVKLLRMLTTYDVTDNTNALLEGKNNKFLLFT